MTLGFVTSSPARPAAPASAPAKRPANSAAAALAALQATEPGVRPPSALRSLAAAVLTFGIWPVMSWGTRFQRVVDRDRDALYRLTAWSGRRLAEPDFKSLAAAAGRVRRRPVLAAVPVVLAVLSALAVVWTAQFDPARQGLLPNPIGFTFGFRWAWLSDPSPAVAAAFLTWTVGLSAAYAAHLVQVHLHAQAVRRYLDEFNRSVSVEEGFGPVLLEPFGLGFSPMWVLAAGALLFLNAVWAVPFAVAGATDRRYQRRASVRLRRDLAARVRDVIFDSPELSRPIVKVPVDAVRCVTPGCGGALAHRAKFCPRCGARRGRSVDLAA